MEVQVPALYKNILAGIEEWELLGYILMMEFLELTLRKEKDHRDD